MYLPTEIFMANGLFYNILYSTVPICGTLQENRNTDYRFPTIYMYKVIPLQAWTGPEGSRSLRLPDFKTIST